MPKGVRFNIRLSIDGKESLVTASTCVKGLKIKMIFYALNENEGKDDNPILDCGAFGVGASLR